MNQPPGYGGPPPPGGYGPPPGGYGGPPGAPPPGGYGGPPGAPPGPPGGFGGPPGFAPPPPPPVFRMGGGGGKATLVGRIIGGVFVAIVAIAIGIGAWYAHTHPTLYVVNTTGKDGLSVVVDGSPVITGLRNATSESAANVQSKSFAAGVHKIEIKDASGKVIETQTFDMKSGSDGVLFAPQRAKEWCFYYQTDVYSTGSGASHAGNRFRVLDPTKTIWEIPGSVDYWWQDTPTSVEVKNSSTVTKHALRQGRCSDPNFKE